MAMQPSGLERVVERCTWCGSRLDAHAQVVIAGGRFAADPSSPVEPLRGHVVSVRTAHGSRTVRAIVPLRDTPAHHAGYDLLFVLCSVACRDALDAAIGDDPMLVSVISSSSRPTRLPSRRRLQS